MLCIVLLFYTTINNLSFMQLNIRDKDNKYYYFIIMISCIFLI